MKLDVTLQVGLKGADLVANTAYLTLVDKLGYAGRLLGLLRLDSWAWETDTADPSATLGRLKRMLSVQSTFFNRNKHNYLLECRWDGSMDREGLSRADLGARLRVDARRRLDEPAGDFDSQRGDRGVMVRAAPVFRTEVLIEDLDGRVRTALARKLVSELQVESVRVSELGTRWSLALMARDEEEAERTTREIVVTDKRDSGLLLNPNHQGFKLLVLERTDLGRP